MILLLNVKKDKACGMWMDRYEFKYLISMKYNINMNKQINK